MRIWRTIKFTSYVLVGVLLGWLIYEWLTFPDLARLRDQNPETTATFQHIGILSLEFHVDKLSRPLL